LRAKVEQYKPRITRMLTDKSTYSRCFCSVSGSKIYAGSVSVRMTAEVQSVIFVKSVV
jgi:hypothetical protein